MGIEISASTVFQNASQFRIASLKLIPWPHWPGDVSVNLDYVSKPGSSQKWCLCIQAGLFAASFALPVCGSSVHKIHKSPVF
ncbi:MAG TPA: hypothetical protein DCM07_09475 [Planctomycetaceae bacterium]|nr:hypothetical protein [Gimesia sp.]HAH45066.1 hypothetical protein [Planctomycetaceae bacterium]HBL43596.1 hypothetical protein [Planctomycetaceae bacterium]